MTPYPDAEEVRRPMERPATGIGANIDEGNCGNDGRSASRQASRRARVRAFPVLALAPFCITGCLDYCRSPRVTVAAIALLLVAGCAGAGTMLFRRSSTIRRPLALRVQRILRFVFLRQPPGAACPLRRGILRGLLVASLFMLVWYEGFCYVEFYDHAGFEPSNRGDLDRDDLGSPKWVVFDGHLEVAGAFYDVTEAVLDFSGIHSKLPWRMERIVAAGLMAGLVGTLYVFMSRILIRLTPKGWNALEALRAGCLGSIAFLAFDLWLTRTYLELLR
jgi:hypothetical protein